MKKWFVMFFICILVPLGTSFAYDNLDFTLHKLESGKKGNTLLVVGGMQGDEPGGFNAASLLVTHYKITKGNVWVVPNLNFISIIKRSRGVHGDFNRKFAKLNSSDPEYTTVNKIKSIVLDEQVDVILNLHDGGGFYRTRYVDRLHNPHRWGQCVIIDQKQVENERFGNLNEIAGRVVEDVNRHLYSDEHAFRIMNTRTREGNREMEKTLTYFAIRNQKPAFGLEVSKTFPTYKRSYYHIRMLESFMDIVGIEYRRNFELSANGVKDAIDNNVRFSLNDNKIFLDVANARHRLGFIPLKKGYDIEFTPSNPLITIVNSGESYRVYHGNRRVTRIIPQYFEYDLSLDAITMQIDGDERHVNFGKMVAVGSSFVVLPKKGYRVNVIGFKKTGAGDESGIPIVRDSIQTNFSVDKDGRLYRVEVYKKKKFAGMVLVNFSGTADPLHASRARKLSLLRQPD